MSESLIPSGPVAVVFPGQGSQFVGMTSALQEASTVAAEVIRQADEILEYPLSQLIQEGPAEVLEDTINAQPAILTASLAAYEALRSRLDERGASLDVRFTAGHSLGEFTALVAAGSLPFDQALALVRERGRLMKEAGMNTPGGMAAILGLDDDAIAAVCTEASDGGAIVVPANRNCPGQVVISGAVSALERAMELAKAAGARRVTRLGVSIASHSPLMAGANAEFGRVLEEIELQEPDIPVIGNVSAEALHTVKEIDAELRLQMERPVDWTGSIQHAIDHGVETFIELGPGNVLGGLIKRINREVRTITPGDMGVDLPAATNR